MPRLNRRSIRLCYRADKQTAIAYVHGKRVTLGPWPDHPLPAPPDVQAAYARLVATQSGILTPELPPDQKTTVAMVCAAVIDWAESYYLQSNEAWAIKDACKHLVSLFSDTPVDDLGVRHMRGLQEMLVRQNRARTGINKILGRIRRVISQGVQLGLVNAATLTACSVTRPLLAGHCRAPESIHKPAADDDAIRAILPHLPGGESGTVAALLQVQRLTGMRPGEVVRMNLAEIDRSKSDCWIYSPRNHKTAHKGKKRVIPIGPVAIAILMRFLRADGKYLFSPASTVHKPEARSSRKPGDHYRVSSYGRAVALACQRAGIPVFRPQQIRKAKAQELRNQFGVDVAAAILGHGVEVAERYYSSPNYGAAIEAAKQTG